MRLVKSGSSQQRRQKGGNLLMQKLENNLQSVAIVCSSKRMLFWDYFPHWFLSKNLLLAFCLIVRSSSCTTKCATRRKLVHWVMRFSGHWLHKSASSLSGFIQWSLQFCVQLFQPRKHKKNTSLCDALPTLIFVVARCTAKQNYPIWGCRKNSARRRTNGEDEIMLLLKEVMVRQCSRGNAGLQKLCESPCVVGVSVNITAIPTTCFSPRLRFWVGRNCIRETFDMYLRDHLYEDDGGKWSYLM